MLWIILILVVLIALYCIGVYNNLIVLRNKVKDQWSQIEVHLKRRYDLIPNIVETTKGYAKHESETLENVIAARNKAVTAVTPEAEMEAAGDVTQALSKLFALAESYPDLKANENFLKLQDELKNTEDKIAYTRQFYNDSVLAYNNKVEMFPSNVIANMFKFTKEKFFETDDQSKETPQVKF